MFQFLLCQDDHQDKRPKVRETEDDEFVILMPDVNVMTLRNLLLFVYTDHLPTFSEDGVIEAIELMKVAQDLFLPPQGIPNHEACSMRRLYAMCEMHLHTAMSPFNVGDILWGAVKIGSKRLEKDAYAGLARMKPMTDVDCNKRLIQALVRDPDLLALAMSAAAGNNKALAGEAPPDFSQSIPTPSMLRDLRHLLRKARTADCKQVDDSDYADCRLIAAGPSEERGLAAHRFILAARSEYYSTLLSAPMEEATTRQIRVSLQPAPSVPSMLALLNYLYTGEVDATVEGGDADAPMTPSNWLDVLSMLDGLGGTLAERASIKLRSKTLSFLQSSLGSMESSECWMLLREASIRQNPCVQSMAMACVMDDCTADKCADAASFAGWKQMPDLDWWTPAMESDLFRQFMNWSFKKATGKPTGHVDNASYDKWTLVVTNPWRNYNPRHQYNYSNTSEGNSYLVSIESLVGCGCSQNGLGSIEAHFDQPIYVDHILVAPLEHWGPARLSAAVVQVMSDDGQWVTVCDKLSGSMEAVYVCMVASKWRLHGNYIATSLFKFMP